MTARYARVQSLKIPNGLNRPGDWATLLATMSTPTLGQTSIVVSTGKGPARRITKPFVVGRDSRCDVVVDDQYVGRKHLAVGLEGGVWVASDLQTENGSFVNGRRTARVVLDGTVVVNLGGPDGPALTLKVEFGAPQETIAGGRVTRARGTIIAIQRKAQRLGWVAVFLAVAAFGLGVWGYATYRELGRHRSVEELASDNFYQLKAIELKLAQRESSGQRLDDEAAEFFQERDRQNAEYDKFLQGLKLQGRELTPRDRLILRVTRELGECDLLATPAYLDEVDRFIKQWRATGRFELAVKLAAERGYTGRIVQELKEQRLPLQFFYLAMQESSFNPLAVGPPTKNFGIAKGMWQFIPDTARRFGLKPGPLQLLEQPDPQDERSDWVRATVAAAKYIKEIYRTDAQASGLLVMASYNWGERRVVERLKRMPGNPQDRNFWKLLQRYPADVPTQTYNYVFYIVSAAVIGEDPRLFGYHFDNPIDAALKVTLTR